METSNDGKSLLSVAFGFLLAVVPFVLTYPSWIETGVLGSLIAGSAGILLAAVGRRVPKPAFRDFLLGIAMVCTWVMGIILATAAFHRLGLS